MAFLNLPHFCICQYYSYGSELWYKVRSSQPELRCTPLVEACSGQEQYYIRSAWYWVSIWVRLTFSQMYPPVETSSGQEQYYIRSAWHLVRLWSGWSLLRCNTPGSGIWWPRVVLTWVQLTWAQMYCLPKWNIPNLPKLWHFTSFTFLYLSILQLRYWIVMQYCTCSLEVIICQAG